MCVLKNMVPKLLEEIVTISNTQDGSNVGKLYGLNWPKDHMLKFQNILPILISLDTLLRFLSVLYIYDLLIFGCFNFIYVVYTFSFSSAMFKTYKI